MFREPIGWTASTRDVHVDAPGFYSPSSHHLHSVRFWLVFVKLKVPPHEMFVVITVHDGDLGNSLYSEPLEQCPPAH